MAKKKQRTALDDFREELGLLSREKTRKANLEQARQNYREKEAKTQYREANKKQQAERNKWESIVDREQSKINSKYKLDLFASPRQQSEYIKNNLMQGNTTDRKPFSLYNENFKTNNEKAVASAKERNQFLQTDTYKKYWEENQKSKLTQYLADKEQVENEKTTTMDKINIFRPFLARLEDAITPGNYKLENGEYVDLPSYNELKANKVASEMGTLGQSIHSASGSIGGMVPSIVASLLPNGLGRIAGPAMTFVTVQNSAYNQKLLEGYEPEQAKSYSIVNAGLEAGLSAIMGGVTKQIGGKMSFLSSNLSRISENVIKNPGARRILSNLEAEEAEELMQMVLDPINEHVTLGEYKNIGDALSTISSDDAKITALSTLFTIGITEGKSSFKTSVLSKNIEAINKQYGTDFKVTTEGKVKDTKTDKEVSNNEINDTIKKIKIAEAQDQQLQDIEQRQQQVEYDYQNGNISEEEYNNEYDSISNELKMFKEEVKKGITNPISEIEAMKNMLQEQYEHNTITENKYNEEISKLQTKLKEIAGNQEERYTFKPGENKSIAMLEESASKYFDNSEKTRNYIDMLKKISTDKGLTIVFDDSLGEGINGQYENGIIRINPNSTRAGEFIAVHELTHAIGTEQMRKIIDTYRKSNPEFNNAVQNLINNYEGKELTEEAMADVAGQLFGNQEFINNLSDANPGLFKRIYQEIKYLYHQFTGYRNQNQFIEDLQYKWEQAYRSNNKLNNKRNYFIENIASYNEKEYNSIKQKKLGSQEYANLSTIIGNGTNIAPGLNIIENIYDYETGKYKNYEIYYKSKGQFKVVDAKDSGDYANARYSKEISERDETTGSREFNNKMGFDFARNTAKNSTNDRLSDIDQRKTYSKRESDKYDRQNSRELDNSSFSLDKNANAYNDLLKTNSIEYFRKEDGNVKVYLMDTNNNVVNDMSLWSNGNAIATLGEQLGNHVFETANEDNQTIRLGNDINNTGSETDYFMTHRPSETGAFASDISDNGNVMPQDVYDHPEYYYIMDEAHKESYDILKGIRGNPNAEITIYRATPGAKINKGDWITLSKTYAEKHNQRQFDGKANILEKTVKAKDVQFAGDDICEFGYYPDMPQFSKNNTTWKEYLESNFKSKGTITKFADIVKKQKKNETIVKPLENKNNNLTSSEQQELKTLREIDNAGIAGKEELKRIEYLEKKSKGAIKYPELKKEVQFKDISREYGKYRRDLGDFNSKLLNNAMNSISDYRGRRTKQQWLDVAENIGSNYKGTSQGLTNYAVQSWFKANPNSKEHLNRQGQKYVKFSVDEWVNSVYKGAEVGEIQSSETKQVIKEIKKSIEPVKKDMAELTKQIDEMRTTLKLPKRKVLNPSEIAKLTKQDASTTPTATTVKVSTGSGESKFANNIENKTNMLTDEAKQRILAESDTKYYQEVTNKESMGKALNRLDTGGRNETLSWFQKDSTNADSTDVAEGWILLKQYQDSGDYDGMVEVAKKLREIGTKAGQTVQAFNIMERMTPEGMVKYAQSELTEAYNKMVKNKTKAWIDANREKFDLQPNEVQFILDTMKEVSTMEDGYDKKVKLAEIQKIMTDKLPADKGKAIKSWMRISMLFNPKTQVRNVTGNAIIAPINYIGDLFASKADKVIAKKTGIRTTGTMNVKAILKGMKEGAYQATNDYKKGINTKDMEGNRFEMTEGKSFNDKTIIGKSLNRVDNLLNYVMDAGDRIFSQSSFENSLQNQMLLNNTTEVTQEMIDIARSEALQRTWNDNNNYTRFVLNVRKGLNAINIHGYGLGDVLIPFAKTPANLTKAIIDYSPAGLINAVTEGKNLKRSLENGQYTPQMQHAFVQRLGKATAGTMLYVLGYALAKSGITSGESDDDKDTANFLKNTLGVNSYSIKIGDKSFTYDWAQPIASPISIMANIVNSSKNKEQALLEGVVSSLDTAGSILLEQSFLQSLNDVLNSKDGLVSGIINETLELPARAIPTFMKQIADLTDKTQRTSYEYGRPIQSAINNAKSKVPGLNKTLAPSVDTMGREIQRYGGKNNIFNVFLNPANVATENISKSAEEIYRLYQQTGDKTIMPRVSPNYINQKGEKTILTSMERAEYQKISGKIIDESIEKLLDDQDYQNLTDLEKADVVNKIVDYSYNRAKKDVLDMDMAPKYNKINEYVKKGGDPADYYLHKKEIDYSLKHPSKYNYMNQIGNYDDANKYIEDITKLRNKNKNLTTAQRKVKVIKYVNSLNLNIPQKAMLIRNWYSSYNGYNEEIYNYINKSDLTPAEKLGVYKQLGFKVKGGKVYW